MSSLTFIGLFVAGTAGPFLAALLTGRWWLLLVPAIGWPLFYLGLIRGWWGAGVGDGWQYMAVLVTLGGITGVALGLVIHRARRAR